MYSAVGFLYLMEFLQHKHGLSEAVMDLVNILALQGYLSSLKLPQCASTVKLIHDWIPTYATLCKQKRGPCPLCPQCKSAVETSDHVITCPYIDAMIVRANGLRIFLTALKKAGTPSFILCTLEYKLSLTLDIPFNQTHQCFFCYTT
jgi:hypothetical protein